MSRFRFVRFAVVAGAVAFAVGAWSGAASAAPVDPAPTPVPSPDYVAPSVELNLYEFRPSQSVKVSISGFTAPYVNTTICGNGGLRGSTDCNMAASEAVEIDPVTGTASISFIANAPALPCPCVIRVSSPSNDEVAVADVVLVGHPVAELVTPNVAQQPLAASLSVEPVSTGFFDWARSSLGGTTAYDAKLTIRNRSTEVVERVTVDAFAGRGADDVSALFDFPQPGVLGPNQTWERTVRVFLPSPVYDNTTWSVAVASANPTITLTDSTSHLPGLLIAFIGFLVFDLIFLLARLVRRRRLRERLDREQPDSDHDSDLDSDLDRDRDAQPVPLAFALT